MEPKQNKYPIFEANQVLTNLHLNQVFDYLDEQERLTRANLIGIGIVCGLEIRLEVIALVSTIHLAKGCGVTSEGYLIVEPQGVALVSYRDYTLPDDLDYPTFRDALAPDKPQYPLWELFPAGEPETTPLGTPANFLSDKAVLLFYELKKAGLRTCSPNECNDKGTEVTATVRRLLIKQADLNKIIAAANALPGSSTTADLEKVLLAQLDLPDLRLPRFDVPNTKPVTTNDILAAFLAVFPPLQLARTTGKALSAAYQAFRPLVQQIYPSDPFADFIKKFGFLDKAPEDTAQVQFLQYYYDLFDDFLKAYQEFRQRGLELLCACCPPSGLFPRHLMLGLLSKSAETKPSIYRHYFTPSPALAGMACTKELVQLFQRLVEMTVQFSNRPPLPKPADGSKIDEQVRLTPSSLGLAPLSDKAIPYYYLQDGKPPLYQIWNYKKTRLDRANQNLSYRSDEYAPAAPDFVTKALAYDLEPYNFLRIEGHLGKDFKTILKTLLSYKAKYRLPVDIIALRTGVFDKSIPVDLSQETCRFQDLEALYDSLREELLSTLSEGVIYFYDIPLDKPDLKGGKPKHPLLQTYAPFYRYQGSTMGAWYEQHLKILSVPYIDIDQSSIDDKDILKIAKLLLIGTSGLSEEYFAFLILLFYLTHLAEAMPDSLDTLEYDAFENKYQDFTALGRFFRSSAATKLPGALKEFIPQEDFIDHLDQLLAAGKLEPIKAVQREYELRLKEVKQKQLLSYFLKKHPGLQHKAGVPLGGTFLLVYHGKPKPQQIKVGREADEFSEEILTQPTRGASKIDPPAMAAAFQRLSDKPQFKDDLDIQFLINAFKKDPGFRVPPFLKAGLADDIIKKTVDNLEDGTVIADFFLPYLCCSDCPPIQYVFPPPRLGLTVKLGCTDPTGSAEVTLTPQGGTAPFSYQLDQESPQELTGPIKVLQGPHTLKVWDSAGAESALQSLTVPGPLTIGTETYTDDFPAQTYTVSFAIAGGTAPYTADASGTVSGQTFTSVPVATGKPIKVEITDKAGCTTSKEFQHTVNLPCNLPCEGKSRRCAYRLWLQPPVAGTEAVYQIYKQESEVRFQLNGEIIPLPGSDTFLQFTPSQLNGDFHGAIGAGIKKLQIAINQALIAKFGGELGKNRLVVSYEPDANDPFGIVWIEYFVCETFSLEFDFSFAKPDPAFSLRMLYTNDAAILINRRLNNKKSPVPAFDCRERDRCLGTDFQNLCKGLDFKPVITIERGGENQFQFSGKVTSIDPNQIIAWVWDVFVAQPTEPFYQGQIVKTQLLKPGGQVRLTAITKEGCFSFVDQNVLP